MLLLERGNVADSWVSKVPLMSSNLFREGTQAARWETLPMPDVDNRVLEVVRGEALGGTSRVNGMVYTRGAPGDYNRWKEMGHSNWGYDDLEPYFVKSETALSQPPSSFRGREGRSQTPARSLARPYPCLQVLDKTGHLKTYRSKFCISKTAFRSYALN